VGYAGDEVLNVLAASEERHRLLINLTREVDGLPAEHIQLLGFFDCSGE
jgi:hypothetical protein